MSQKEESLTPAQTARQDLVDNSIHKLLNKLDPRQTTAAGGDEPDQLIPWNIEQIARVREVIADVLAVEIQILDEDRDQFELSFYPFIRS